MGEAAREFEGRENSSMTSDGSVRSVLERRASKEIILAFMGAVGCGLPRIVTEFERQLGGLGYQVQRIKLSDFIKSRRSEWIGALSGPDAGVSYLENQTGGNVLRNNHSFDILAQYAVSHIARSKIAADAEAIDPAKELPRVAYLIDQIKHPDEALLLRLVYRNLFYLVGVLSTEEHRLSRLMDQGLSDDIAKRVKERDRKEAENNGQQLEKAFKLADYFIQHPFGVENIVEDQISRFLKLAHGNNGITPTKHEHAMYVAHASGLKSACFSRQVGAAIVDASNKVIAVGCNDVPQYGGGLYSVESTKDNRCAYWGDRICENDHQKDVRKEAIKLNVEREFGKLLENIKDEDIRKAIIEKMETVIDVAYKSSGLPEIIEFSRAVHAEMDAIVSVAREGAASTVGATLYTTTFPCHNCARHIVAAGIDSVYYIEPYEKSLAVTSHSDSIIVLDHDGSEKISRKSDVDPTKMVKFIHFAGVAPRIYTKFFQRDKRKGKDGRFLEWGETEVKSKIMVEFLDSYRDFEAKVTQKFEEEFPVGPQPA
ncbi:anti-phage dCTP deaminase [Paraburkholderia strydomiana]|uniref:Anti-phage dCTP deaminase n=1 Tax=Paraburkholderia strydomiana TaxID=1245417 RepID=A0ABW9EGU5_9BURK